MIRSRAFTLIETLITVSIIIVLMTLTFPYLQTARLRARDRARMADLNTIYRILGAAGGSSIASYWPMSAPDEGDLVDLAQAIGTQGGGGIFSQVPHDPRNV